jgi:hypothetical protein
MAGIILNHACFVFFLKKTSLLISKMAEIWWYMKQIRFSNPEVLRDEYTAE